MSDQEVALVAQHGNFPQGLVISLEFTAPTVAVLVFRAAGHTAFVTIDEPLVTISGLLIVVMGSVASPIEGNSRLNRIIFLA